MRLGRVFQAISIAVVRGMLAGIGLPLMFSQGYSMSDAKAPGTPIENILGVPGLVADTPETATDAATEESSVPGPPAAWFYLDTRPTPTGQVTSR